MSEGPMIKIDDLRPCKLLKNLEGTKIVRVIYIPDDGEFGCGEDKIMCDPEGNGPGWLHGVEHIR